MICVGVDYSGSDAFLGVQSETGIAAVQRIKIQLSPKQIDWTLAQLQLVAIEFTRLAAMGRPDLVLIEAPLMYQNGWTTVKLASVATVLFTKAVEAGLPAKLVNNQTWKKAVLGKGNATKFDSLKYVQGTMGYATKDHNVADALCIAEYGISTLVNHIKPE